MAFAFVQEAHNFTYAASGNPSLTTASAVTKGNLLIAMVQTTSNTPMVMDDGRNLWAALNATPFAGGRGYIQVFYAIAESTRVMNLSVFGVTETSGVPYYNASQNTLANAGLQVMEFSGTSTYPIATPATTATGTSTAPASTITDNTYSGDLIVGAAIGTAGDTIVETAGWTNAAGAGTSTSMIYHIETATGTFTPTFLQSASAAWGCIAMAWKVPAGTWTISGALGASGAGAQVSFTSQTTGAIVTAAADGSGNYTSPSLESDLYNVQPQRTGTGFTPNGILGVHILNANITGQNFTSTPINSGLVFNQLYADSMTRANENPLSNSGMWNRDGTPVPPWDYPFQLLSNEAVTSNATIVANFAGPYTGDGDSVMQNHLPGGQYVQFQVDALNATIGKHAIFGLGAKSSLTNATFYMLTGYNNGDGTATISVFGQGTDGTSSALPAFPLGQGNLNSSQMFTSAYAYWRQTISFSLGDNFRLAVVSNTLFIYHNGSIIGTILDPQPQMYMGTMSLYCACLSPSDVQLSNVVAGGCYVSGAAVAEIVDNGTNNSAVGSLTTLTFNNAVGDVIAVLEYHYNNTAQTITGVTDLTSNTYTLAGSMQMGTNAGYISCYYSVAANAQTSNTVKVQYSANVTYAEAIVYHLPYGTTLDVFNPVNASTAVSTITATLTTTGSDEIVLAFVTLNSPTGNVANQKFPAGWETVGATPLTGGFANAAYQVFSSPQSLSVPITVSPATTGAAFLVGFNMAPKTGGGGNWASGNRKFINKR